MENVISIPANYKKFQEHLNHRLDLALNISKSKSALAHNIEVRYLTVLTWFRGSTPTMESYLKIEEFLSSIKVFN